VKRFFPGKLKIRSLADIVRPTLLVQEERARLNIQNMSHKARQSGVTFRPHFKTHQSARIGEWFRVEGVQQITVSSLNMAEYFARHGWKDITVAFPLNIREKKLIQKLANNIRLNLLVESAETIHFLNENIKAPLQLWIKVDVGYQRTGISWDNENDLIKLARQILHTPQFTLEGLLTHAGHSYHTRGKSNLITIYKDAVHKMNHSRNILKSAGIVPLKISYGDTPTCSVVDRFNNVDEVRPGNFVFYDIMQLQIGSCKEQDIACALICPVVAKHSQRQELLIHGGAVHLSKEFILNEQGQKIFGYLAPWDGKAWGPIIPDSRVSALSQEHGIIKASPDFFRQIRVGDLLAVLPVHSCLAMDLMGDFLII
jgi:D-serine deaminase-like pyridoxal phosphate-dependent protein